MSQSLADPALELSRSDTNFGIGVVFILLVLRSWFLLVIAASDSGTSLARVNLLGRIILNH